MDGFIPALACITRSSHPRRVSSCKIALLFITTILALAGHQHLHAEAVTTQEPPSQATPFEPSGLPQAPTPQNQPPLSPDDLATIPRATLLPPAHPPDRAIIESDDPQSKHGDFYYASGDVILTYGDHILRADSITYNAATGDVELNGHLHLTGGENNESIEASHGTYNLHTTTGQFYDVTGSVGLGVHAAAPVPVIGASTPPPRTTYFSPNPFLFQGRLVLKTGPESYVIYNGSVTSCLLPHPDWQLFARKIMLDNGRAHAASSTFTLLGIPLLFLPYVTHPVDTSQRQSGLDIPVFGYSSASQNTGSKGFTFGDQAYLTLGRSADLTVGTLYYSLRGFSENGTFRYRGLGDDFFTAHFSALQDRGFTAADSFVTSSGATVTENIYTNQGGQDVTTGFRRQLDTHTRLVGDAEYLSSYIYREAFTENFNQAVSSDITSIAYVTHQDDGYSVDARFDRYQGLKVVPVVLLTGTTPAEEVKIFHAPSIDFTAIDHAIPGTPFLWSLTSSAAGLKRVQPNFVSSGITERLDVRPEISLPLSFDGWHTFSSIAARETFYSRSRQVPYAANGTNPPNATPIEITQPLNRSDIEVNVDIRPPVLERTFDVPEKLKWIFGDQVRHTIEPDIAYRSVHGIDNFLSILRFDDTDLASDTNELEYGLTQHVYFRAHPKPANRSAKPKPGCPAKPAALDQSKGSAAPASTEPEATEAAEAEPSPASPNPEEQPTNDANGIPNASATAPDQPTRTHRRTDPCARPPSTPPQQEWFSWQLAQKHFFDQNFGGAVIDTRRNIFSTTLDFSGIAFLTEPRSITPLKSRMRFRTSSHADIEYDFDYDTGASKFTSQNVFVDAHEGRVFGGISYARLNAPGRFYTEVVNPTTNTATGLTRSATSNFSQMRVLFGYGTPSKPGFSAAGSAGLDLNAGSGQDTSGLAQYITIETSYNWNCCGVSVEYRKYDLGTIRDEGAYRFNFTLANIGTAGNLRRAEALF